MLTRRLVQDEDRPFLLRLYAAGRADEMAVFPWTAAQKEAFLSQQFAARNSHYQAEFPDAVNELLLRDSVPIGSLSVVRRPSEIHLLDIALLPEQRHHGLGTTLLQELIREADAACLPLRLHVEPHNPALRLYTRLGFLPLSRSAFYVLMEHPVGGTTREE